MLYQYLYIAVQVALGTVMLNVCTRKAIGKNSHILHLEMPASVQNTGSNEKTIEVSILVYPEFMIQFSKSGLECKLSTTYVAFSGLDHSWLTNISDYRLYILCLA